MKLIVVVALLGLVAAASASTWTRTYACGTVFSHYYDCGGWWFNRRTCAAYTTRYCSETCRDGGFTNWSESRTECSATCGGGSLTVTRTRTCTNPSRLGCGQSCSGHYYETDQETCNTNPCPVDGGWTDWTEWEDTTQCTVLCGGGLVDQRHNRTCTNPEPMYGGRDCEGAAQQNRTIECNTNQCGSICPEGEDTYVSVHENREYYYRCVQGQANVTNTRAVLMRCPKKTHWDQSVKTCVKTPEPIQVATCVTGQRRAVEGNCRYYQLCNNGEWMAATDCGTTMKFDESIQNCNWASAVSCQ